MRVLFRVASVTILPLGVYAAVWMLGAKLTGGPPVSLSRELFFVLINSLLFAAPQFLWLLIAYFGRFAARTCDAGLVAADALLIFFCGLICAQSDTRAGILWLGYLPLAFIASLLVGSIVRTSAPKV